LSPPSGRSATSCVTKTDLNPQIRGVAFRSGTGVLKGSETGTASGLEPAARRSGNAAISGISCDGRSARIRFGCTLPPAPASAIPTNPATAGLPISRTTPLSWRTLRAARERRWISACSARARDGRTSSQLPATAAASTLACQRPAVSRPAAGNAPRDWRSCVGRAGDAPGKFAGRGCVADRRRSPRGRLPAAPAVSRPGSGAVKRAGSRAGRRVWPVMIGEAPETGAREARPVEFGS